MSTHERERLSAYLDGELAPNERRAVDSHLEACAECRGRLAELSAVDEAARALLAEAPAGYFDGFAARVRARIEHEGARRAKAEVARRRLPVWTWAAAAALLLAVVTPLTLRRAPREGTPTRATRVGVVPTPATLGPDTAPTRALPTEAHVAGDVAPPGESEDRSPEQVLRRPAAAPPAEPFRAESLRDEEVAVSRPAEPERKDEGQVSLAAVPPTREAPAEQRKGTGGFAAAPPPAPSAEAAGLGASEIFRESEEEAAPSPATVETDAPSASTVAPMAEAPAAGRPAEPRGRRQGPAGLEKAAALSPDEAEYLRLASARPVDAQGWRQIREAWRAFAAGHSESRHADEARVRVIEAGVAAWRAGGHEDDLARAREDLAAYLDRGDARLEGRARRALESAPNP